MSRTSYKKVLLATAVLTVATLSNIALSGELKEPLDRHAIVSRHNINSEQLESTLPIGNGNFCFNVDGTGLQTFAGNTLSHWGWYSDPLLDGFTWADVPPTGTYYQGRLTGGDPWPQDKAPLYSWVRNSPHQMNLARVRFVRKDGTPLDAKEIKTGRVLDLWSGVHTSAFQLNGKETYVTTCVTDDVQLDTTVAVQIDSDLVRSGELIVQIDFPFPDLTPGPWVGTFSNEKTAPFEITKLDDGKALVVKRLLQNEYAQGVVGNYTYATRVDAVGGTVEQVGDSSTIKVTGSDSGKLEISITFDGGDYAKYPCDDSVFRNKPVSFDEADKISHERWGKFWKSGAAVDLSGSSDPRWMELERRIVLSQYQLRANSAGEWPCGESGLITICPWSGRFHMEMVWWHLIHWWTWDRADLADEAISIYPKVQDGAKQLAEQLGYKGYKWQKEIAPDGRTAPWVGNLVLLWKQPHPIFFAEMDYRRNPTRETLEKWADIVEQTAVHMADYATKDENGVYHLAPAMPPSEQGITRDEVFDLAYWRWGLDAANKWRERLGKERVVLWDEVRDNMEPLPVEDGVFVHSPEWRTSFKDRNWEHPDLIGVYGMIPPIDAVDPIIAERTLERVVAEWKWDRCWGWDFPWIAMSAARHGRADLAVDMLLNDAVCNYYDESGVNLGGPSTRGGKGPYLPGNGGLLYAIAGMCAGFDENADDDNTNANMPLSGDSAPGFPEGWTVKWEGLKRPL
ncbi:MAG: hypothetical protein IK077_08925 [Thermoguttaceae bacterium]|nr:hypothetical protein [Thermoguttaceae bacterium]